MSRHAPSPAIHAGTPSRVAVGMGGLTRLQPPRDLRLQRGSRGLRSARYAELATSFLPRQLATPLRRLPVPLQRAHSSPSGERSSARACSRTAWNVSRQADRRMSVACRAAESGDVAPADWVNTAGTHKRPQQVFYSKKGEKFLLQTGERMELMELPEGTRVVYPGLCKDGESNPNKMRAMIRHALDNPVGQPPLKERLQQIKHANPNPKILMAFDDVSVPLPPMRRPDLRQLILEEAERDCVAAGITDIRFVCSIALHRFVRPDEFRHICGGYLYGKYYPQRMGNYNAVDMHETVDIGVTRHGEAVQINRHFAEADLVVYANVNYVSMDGGYKSYATGLVHYNCLRHNHDSNTLRNTRSLFDPARSALHRSFHRIGRMMQKHTDVFHVETVVDDQLFPFYVGFVSELVRNMSPLQKLFMHSTILLLKLLPLWLCVKVFWFMRAPFGLLQVTAGETQAVHERTLATIYRDKVMDVQGQADILILAPSALGPYTKDMFLNPLLVNTYALGYYYNMYVDGVPLLKEGGCVIMVNEMNYEWSSPAHDAYRRLFEEVLAVAPGLDEFERFQQQFVQDEHLNDIYRQGLGPAAVHGFYMYTWAAHGMDKVGKVYVVGAVDPRGPAVLRWEMADSIQDAVDQARLFLGNSKAEVTYLRCPPVGYVRVHTEGQGEGSAAEQVQGEAAQAVGNHH
ncbi:unnamed protein product [Closterium sp. NIES-64]|nr:unnamed protein product [Closterium sp. NIES-64]